MYRIPVTEKKSRRRPVVNPLTPGFTSAIISVLLSWEPVDAPGGVGYNVYRYTPDTSELRYLGASSPATWHPEFLDELGPVVSAAYYVTAVNRYGLESEPSEQVMVSFGTPPVYLPLIIRNHP